MYADNILLSREIIEGIRKECGDDFIIMVKLNAHNTTEGVDDLSLLADYVATLKDAGVDLFEISGTDFARQNRNAELYYLDAVKYLRECFPNIVLSLVGGIYTKESIEKTLKTTDYVSLGRALLTQPDFITKLRNEDIENSRCLHCNKCFEIFATKYERCVFGPVSPKLEETFGNEV